ncbi:MAG: T9SS type A sorting domain-containing protein [Brumimicrobium sp.]
MKHLVLGLLLLICFKGLGQNEKNDFDNVYQIGEKYYGDFQILNNIDLFLNRSLNDTTALTYRTQKLRDTLTDANWIYTVISELKSMSKDTNAIPNLMDIFYDVQHYKSELAYEEGKEIFPIGILDYDYYWMKENFSKTRERKVFKPKQFEQSKLNRERLKLIAPLFDYSSLSRTGIIIKRQHFYSNRHLVEDINKLIIEYKNEEYEIQFNEPFEFKENFSQNQIFTLKVYYNNGDSIVNHCKIQSLNNSGDNLLRNSPPPDADKIINEVTNIGSSTLKLKGYVFMSHCNPTTNSSNPRIIKPFILVAGYRPPIPFLNGYKRTWENFNENHEDLLMQLRKNGYDAIILKPGTHIKSGAKAHLLIKYNPCPGIGRPCAPNSLSTHNTPLINRDQRDFEAKESVSTQGHNEYVINMIKVYPNPTRSSFTVSSSNIKIQSIKVFSINGKHLATKEYINEREYKFQNDLDKGTYILIIKTETGELYHKKIVLL